MANVKPQADLVTSITAALADNNAGLISAEDVRSNMADIATSINDIVASGDTQTAYPFHNNVTVKKSTTDGATGRVYVGSGIFFPNSTDASTEQTLPYPGPANISHNDLGNLTAGDPHTQYLPTDGSRTMAGNLGTTTYFINSSGTSNSSNAASSNSSKSSNSSMKIVSNSSSKNSSSKVKSSSQENSSSKIK